MFRVVKLPCVAATLALAAVLCADAQAVGHDRSLAGISECVPGSIHGMRTARLSFAVTAVRPLNARRALTARARTRFEPRNVNGVATVFAVLAERVNRSCRATHYKVLLPVRPNGSTGWVRAVDVRLRAIRTRIAVDLSDRRITLFRDGRAILVTKAVIGAPSTPTPTGRFYVNQRLLARNPLGGYGPGAVGISAFSPVLLNWPQGGPIAIHGTDAPSLIGYSRVARLPASSQRRCPSPAATGRGRNSGRDQAVSG